MHQFYKYFIIINFIHQIGNTKNPGLPANSCLGRKCGQSCELWEQQDTWTALHGPYLGQCNGTGQCVDNEMEYIPLNCETKPVSGNLLCFVSNAGA